MIEPPSVDVLGRKYFPVTLPNGRVVDGQKVIGQITRNREILNFEIQFVDDAVKNIERATPREMLHAIEILKSTSRRLLRR